MSEKRPLIGVTGPDHGGFISWLFTRFALFLAGAKALRITPSRKINPEIIDGLIIGGGSDINPGRYLPDETVIKELKQARNNKELHWYMSILFPLIYIFRKLFSKKYSSGIDKARDDLEFDLLRECIQKNRPVAGICRGMQLINVFFGGTLFQNLQEFYEETPQIRSIFPRKEIVIEPDSRLSQIYNRSDLRVNALHNQAIDNSGKNIKISAREKNTNIVQAIEHEKLDFVIGVQWHPEYLVGDKTQMRFFNALKEACKNNT